MTSASATLKGTSKGLATCSVKVRATANLKPPMRIRKRFKLKASIDVVPMPREG